MPTPIPAVPTPMSGFDPTVFDPNNTYPYPIYVAGMPVLNTRAAAIPTSGDGAWSHLTAHNLSQVLARTLRPATTGGVGIAANQAGLLWSMFILKTSLTDQEIKPANEEAISMFPAPAIPNTMDSYQVFINPVIQLITPAGTTEADDTFISSEGCLSIPGYNSPQGPAQATVRASLFTISYTTITYDSNGPTGFAPRTLSCASGGGHGNGVAGYRTVSGDLGWVMQHEVDHLAGILFPQRAAARPSYLTVPSNASLVSPPTVPINNPLRPDQLGHLSLLALGKQAYAIDAAPYPLATLVGLV